MVDEDGREGGRAILTNLLSSPPQVCLQGPSLVKPQTEVGIQWTFLFICPFALLIYPTIFIYILLIKHNNDRLTPQDNIAKAKVNWL